MKYALHIADVASSTPLGGNRLTVLRDAAGISTERMKKNHER
jgi:predicted PhzF superfamily epimerase YddE/YHI9